MLERALSTALGLLNRLDSDGEDHPEEGDYRPEVLGCRNCGHIYTHDSYFSDIDTQADNCPACTRQPVEMLGRMPYVVDNDEEVFLADDDGCITGPYPDEETARADLWVWFNRKLRHGKGKEEGRHQGKAKVLRLVAKDGEAITQEEDPKEGSQEEGQEGSR